VVDDYGHHPSEIKATLLGAREGFRRRVVSVFQPHRFSRTKLLFDQFSTAFYDADVVLVTEIYPAGEDPVPGLSGAALAAAMRDHGPRDVTFCPTLSEAAAQLGQRVTAGDLVITLGAGDVWRVGQELLEQLSRR